MKKYIENKRIIVMGGGTAGWVSALFFLSKSKKFNYNNKITLIESGDINSIGVGEGTTPIFKTFLESDCEIDESEFLYKVGGSIKCGIKFDNWNFDEKYYYHDFGQGLDSETYKFCQHALNVNYEVDIQRKINGVSFDLLENNKISKLFVKNSAYHFGANSLTSFFKEKCLEHTNFSHITNTIETISYDDENCIEYLTLKDDNKVFGDIFINSLGFHGKDILKNQYRDIDYWDDKLINNSAFAIQVKNSQEEQLEPYTTSTAQDFGWTWKIPQYEKTGYGYVYSDHFVDCEDTLLDDLIKTYSIKENDIFKTKTVKFSSYYNHKQLYKNCLSIGLSSGFVEPLEATSIHMSILGLKNYLDIAECVENIEEHHISAFNNRMKNYWKSTFKFIVFHYFNKDPHNDYWRHYGKLRESSEFDYIPELYNDDYAGVFPTYSYNSVSLGLGIKDYNQTMGEEEYLSRFLIEYFSQTFKVDVEKFDSLNEVLKSINDYFTSKPQSTKIRTIYT